jgi:hypothetical protein
MKMPAFALSFILFSGMLFVLSACAPGSQTETIQNGAAVGVMGSNLDIRTCEIGQIYNTQYGCLFQQTCSAGSGFSPNGCVPGVAVTADNKFNATYKAHFLGAITFNPGFLQNMVQLMQTLGGCNGSCAQEAQAGGWIELQVMPNPVVLNNINMTIGIGTTNPYLQSSSFFGGSGALSSALVPARVVAFNGVNGMQLEAITQFGQDLGFTVNVDSGSLGNPNFIGVLVYQGMQIGTVQFIQQP